MSQNGQYSSEYVTDRLSFLETDESDSSETSNNFVSEIPGPEVSGKEAGRTTKTKAANKPTAPKAAKKVNAPKATNKTTAEEVAAPKAAKKVTAPKAAKKATAPKAANKTTAEEVTAPKAAKKVTAPKAAKWCNICEEERTKYDYMTQDIMDCITRWLGDWSSKRPRCTQCSISPGSSISDE